MDIGLVRFDTDGKIKAKNGTSIRELQPYALGEWYTVKVVLHMDPGQYEVYINGVSKAAGFGLEKALGDIYLVRFQIYNAVAKLYLDDITIYTEPHNNQLVVPDQDTKAAGRITKFVSKTDRALAIADITPAYGALADRVNRGVMLAGNRSRLIIQDEIDLKQPSRLWWFMHTRATVEIRSDGRSAMLYQGDERLGVYLISPAQGAGFTVMEALPLPDSPNPEGQTANTGIKKLAVTLNGVEHTTISVLFVPLDVQDGEPDTLPAVAPLSSWR